MNRRVGGLKKHILERSEIYSVNGRIGRLEMDYGPLYSCPDINSRIGSLKKYSMQYYFK